MSNDSSSEGWGNGFFLTEPSAITEVALALGASKGSQIKVSGTAVLLCEPLALTAKHVIEDFIGKFDRQTLASGSSTSTFHLRALQSFSDKETAAIWNVERLWWNDASDFAVLQLLRTNSGNRFDWMNPRLRLFAPETEERVFAFGYRPEEARITESSIIWEQSPITTNGRVIQQYPEGRPHLPFPCFAFEARIDGGMSGGPVFDSSGELCGIMVYSMDSEEGYIGYAAELWPLLTMRIDQRYEELRHDGEYPFYDLAALGGVEARGWDMIQLESDTDGTTTARTMDLPVASSVRYFYRGVE